MTNLHDFTPGTPALGKPTTFLDLDSLRKTIPSIFAVKPSPKVSERYAFVSTADIIRPLLKAGWGITSATQRHTRKDGRDPQFTRHMVRLRMREGRPLVGDVYPEVVISNSHDRQSRFQIQGGLYRLVCSNGLVIGVRGQRVEGTMMHLGDVARIHGLIESALKTATDAGQAVTRMIGRKLDERAQVKFAASAAKAAYEGEAGFDPKLLLAPRRDEDKGSDLWTVYNRVQENIIQGGVKFKLPESVREVTTRGISHIGRSIDINAKLWDLAAAMLPKTKLAA